MDQEYYKILIALPREEEAKQISRELLEMKLIAGAFISNDLSMHWWQGNIDQEDYWSIIAYSVMENKDQIIQIVKAMSSDEVPGITFFKIDAGNQDFLDWIKENC
jgi:periplasmic divalent cation tolerance protein